MKNPNYCLILAGGNGTRLWPVSRTTKPKQFLDLLGTGSTQLQQTYRRMAAFIEPDHIYISTHVDYLPLVYEQLPEVDDQHILEEPIRRGTLAAVAWGTAYLSNIDPQATVFVTPADHLITDEATFQRDVLHCLAFASQHEELVVMGVQPSRPETGYGYIQVQGSTVEGEDDIYRVKSFTEKPSLDFARIFLQEGDFLWNAGMFCFRADVMLRELVSLVPEYHEELPRMMEEARVSDPRLVPAFFHSLPNRNVDLSILERSSAVCVHRGHFGWADLGTWTSIYDDATLDDEKNAIISAQRTHLYDCHGCLVRLPGGQTLVAKGLDGYVVAGEGDILMICPLDDVAAMRRMHTDTKFS